MTMPIPVICDRCRAQGVAGEDAFAGLGDLLDFEPVPRKIRRVDGWTADRQRAFIAALAVTGSPRQAARAVGKAQWGVDRLREAKGAEGFSAAWDKAMALAAEKGRHRLAAGISAAIEADARPDLAKAAPETGGPEADQDGPSIDAKLELLAGIVRNHLLKLKQERRCRLEGRIAEADFYVRQITCLEVSLDLVSEDGWKFLYDCRRGEHDLVVIAETDMSRLLDSARRDHWAACGDPPRPEHPPRHLLKEHDGFSTEPLEATWSGQALSHEEQRRIFAEQYAKDAAAHIEWEAEARRDYDRRREAPPGMDEEPGLGRPACDLQVDRTDVTNSVRDGPTPEERRAGEGHSAIDEARCAQPSPSQETEK
jgi:hypothetical protein